MFPAFYEMEVLHFWEMKAYIIEDKKDCTRSNNYQFYKDR